MWARQVEKSRRTAALVVAFAFVGPQQVAAAMPKVGDAVISGAARQSANAEPKTKTAGVSASRGAGQAAAVAPKAVGGVRATGTAVGAERVAGAMPKVGSAIASGAVRQSAGAGPNAPDWTPRAYSNSGSGVASGAYMDGVANPFRPFRPFRSLSLTFAQGGTKCKSRS
jgi:hypothetical protein